MQDLPAAGNTLLAPFDPTPEGAYSAPILAVQRMCFECSSIALGVWVHHTVSDRLGFF
jgi:hypothetical protein